MVVLGVLPLRDAYAAIDFDVWSSCSASC